MEKEIEHPINYSPEFLEWWERYEHGCVHVCTEAEKFATWQGWQAAAEMCLPYMRHTLVCVKHFAYDGICTCGYDEVAQKIQGKP